MKKGQIGKIIAIICLIAVIIAGASAVTPTKTIYCVDCNATGHVELTHDEYKAYLEENSDEAATEEAAEEAVELTEESYTVQCETCAGTGEVEHGSDSKYYATFMALIPPLVAIALALITKEVYSSLFIGIALGGFLVANWNPVVSLDNVINAGLISAVSGTAGVFIFLVILGVMVALINKAGGSAAFGRWAETHVKSRIGAMFATFVLGILIFIDDYFNCLTVGSVMLPVTDKHKVSRAKLAFIIDATAAPICMIAPISSWAAAVTDYTKGTGLQGIELFCRAIPYNFYSLLMIVFIISIILMKFDYGPMKIHEFNAMTKGDLFTSGQDNVEKAEAIETNPKGKVIDLILPIVILVGSCILGLLYIGGLFSGESLVSAFENTDSSIALPWGSLIALIVTIIYLIARRVITFKEAMDAIPQGFKAMVPAIMILTFATALKNMTILLGAKYYVGGLMNSAAAGLANFLPAIIFLVACVLAFSTGTSWGTFGILIPIVAAIFNQNSELLYIGMSACLAGAVCGDHCSPISDTTIMSSAGSQSNHVNHVSTQLPYAITVAAISFVVYLIASIPVMQKSYILLPIGIVLTIGTLFVIKAITKKSAVNNAQN